MLDNPVKSGHRVSGGSAAPSQRSPSPLGKNPQEMRLLVVLHRGDRSLASSAPGWDRAVEQGWDNPVFSAGFGSEPLSQLWAMEGVSINLHCASVSVL